MNSASGLATDRKTERERQFADGRGGRRGAESYDHRKAWSSTNHLILSSLLQESESTLRLKNGPSIWKGFKFQVQLQREKNNKRG